jgi:hypothetical protein
MGFFSKRKNKNFDYNPRYYKKDGGGSPYKIEHKFDEFRKTANTTKGIKAKFNSAVEEFKTPQDKQVSKRLYIIMAILVLIFLYIIDFDLSIFFKP